MRSAADIRWLAAGFVLSLALHLLVGLGLVAAIARPDAADEPGTTPPPPAAPPSPPRPGIDESARVTIDWLGFADPTEHEAPRSTSEQSALDPEAGAPASPPPPVPPAAEPNPESPPPPELAAPPSEPVESSPAGLPEPAETGDPLPEAEPAPAIEPAAPSTDVAQLLEMLRRAIEEAREAAPEPAAEAPAPPAPPRPETEPTGARPALPDPRESVATSRDEPIEVRPGKTAAGEGLQIQTVRPTWSVTTRALHSPRDPVVWISFDRKGVVRAAGFEVRGGRPMNTGSEAVDDPLLDAIYRWRASGPRLEELDPEDPSARITLRMRIILRG